MKHGSLMLRSHSKVVMRQFTRNKTFSVINIAGLVAGIFVCLLIAQFVWWEWSFDRHINNGDRTYRINLYNTNNGVFSSLSPGTVSGLAHSIKQSIQGVELIARLSSKTSGIVANKDRRLENREDKIVFADPSIVDVLDLDILDGDRLTPLADRHSLIISESAAHRYFGSTQASGEILEIGFSSATIERRSYIIKGVFADIPANSHQHFDFVLPPENADEWNKNWAWSNAFTYVVLPSDIQPKDLEPGLSQIVRQHHVDSDGDRYILEPITEIRLHALDGTGRASLVNFFIALGVTILSLAWFNYINLSTARFFERMKEVGLRKLIGASRVQLIIQFLVESFFFNFISFCFALILFFLSWPFLNRLIQESIPITLFDEPATLVFLVSFICMATLCTGFYPAIFLSSFKPLQSIRGRITNFADRSAIRKVIIVTQLSISIVMITAVLAIDRQVDFMREQSLGISIDQTVIIDAPLLTEAATVHKYETLKHKILQLPNVRGVTYASSFPGAEIDWHRTDITLGEENAAFRYSSRIISIGTEFLDVFELPLLLGRNFDPEMESDSKAMLINEEACKMFGFENYTESLGKIIFVGSRRFEVIGVVGNYHYRSLQNPLQPILYMQGYPRNPAYAIKTSSKNIPEAISAIENHWKEAYIGNVFKYYFLDDFFNRQYISEERAGSIVSGLTLMAIFISSSGLFGLSLYTVSRRIKEIGIRKALGATISSVVLLLSRDIVKLMVVGALITVPIAYLSITHWLESYAYKMSMDVWLFAIPIASIILLTLITISFQTVAAAKRNPVESIKYE